MQLTAGVAPGLRRPPHGFLLILTLPGEDCSSQTPEQQMASGILGEGAGRRVGKG